MNSVPSKEPFHPTASSKFRSKFTQNCGLCSHVVDVDDVCTWVSKSSVAAALNCRSVAGGVAYLMSVSAHAFAC